MQGDLATRRPEELRVLARVQSDRSSTSDCATEAREEAREGWLVLRSETAESHMNRFPDRDAKSRLLAHRATDRGPEGPVRGEYDASRKVPTSGPKRQVVAAAQQQQLVVAHNHRLDPCPRPESVSRAHSHRHGRRQRAWGLAVCPAAPRRDRPPATGPRRSPYREFPGAFGREVCPRLAYRSRRLSRDEGRT